MALFHLQSMPDTVVSSVSYKNISPAKKLRSHNRLIQFQQRKMSILKSTSSSTKNPSPNSTKCLSKSKVTLTNFPSCQVCQKDQCQYDDNHCVGFLLASVISMNSTLDSMLENPLSACLKKPPDDQQND
jgi:hypothetical protein